MDETDHMRQCYLDHVIPVPPREDFSGATMPLKIIDPLNQLRTCFQNHYGGGSLPISSGYRDPEHNESLAGSSFTSRHQYARAVDLSPIPDMDGDGTKLEEARWLVYHAKNPSGGCHPAADDRSYYKPNEGPNAGNMVHVEW